MKKIQDFIEETTIQNPEENMVTEAQMYDDVIKMLTEAKENNQPIDEGLFKAIFGGLAGATAGPAIMRGVCRVLGIDERGSIGSLMTSRMVLTALGAYLGWKN